MTLRLRLLLATFVLSLTTTLVLGWGIRMAWQDAERERFQQEFDAATAGLEGELGRAAEEKQKLLTPLCAHDPLVDSALVGLLADDWSTRLLSLRLRVPDLKEALGLNELSLVTDQGEVLAGVAPERTHAAGRADPALAELLSRRAERPSVRESSPAAFSIACKKSRGHRWVGLLGAQHLESYLQAAEARYGLQLTLTEPGEQEQTRAPRDVMQHRISSEALGGRVLVASRSRVQLSDAVRNLDARVIAISLGALGLALVVAAGLSRGLARPVVAFAERARRALEATPQPLPLSGGPELVQAARAFNQTLADLSALKSKLAVTERIAARREVARQVAHEIKNPLSPIRSAIETLRRLKSRNAPEFEDYFDEATRTVLGEVARINDLVRAFSEYASLPSPTPSEFDLSALVRELAHLHEGLGATFVLELEPGLSVHADRAQVTQVVTNLIKNALEACAGSPAPTIHVAVRATEPQPSQIFCELRVSDNGPGVPAAVRARIFEPYLTTKAGGTGLGLAISQRIAVEHGGSLELAPEPASGATFVLSLPQAGPVTSI